MRGLTQLEVCYKTSTINLFQYLNLSDDWMLQLALKYEKEKGSNSVTEFPWEIDLDLETEFDGGNEEYRKCSEVEKNC